jgi:hypothetical protein
MVTVKDLYTVGEYQSGMTCQSHVTDSPKVVDVIYRIKNSNCIVCLA